MSGARREQLAAPVAPAAATAEAMSQVRAVVAGSGTTFLWGMRVLPRPRREAMYAIYAFCRAVDDIADEAAAPQAKLAQLAEWRRELERLYAGRPTHPISRALLGPVRAYDLPQGEFLAILDGMETDARESLQAPSREEFTLYCRRVAGAVGKLSIRAFGETSPAAEELALVLGAALQTTNVLRDLVEDAARGRLYLPRDLLERHGIPPGGAASVLRHPGLPAACAELAAEARDEFDHARRLLAACDRRRIRPAALMLAAYARILGRLEARGWHRLETAVRLSPAEKLWIALRHSLF